MEENRGPKSNAPPWLNAKPGDLRPTMMGIPLPLGTTNPFNLAKAQADAASLSGTGSRASSYRSRRQSVGSQMSHISYSSKRSLRSGKSGRHGRVGKGLKAVEIVEPDMIQVFDEHGNDVTPKPLVQLRTTAMHERILQILPAERYTPESERPSLYSRYSMASSVGSFTPDTLDNDGDRDEGDTSGRGWGSGNGAAASKDVAPHSVEHQKKRHLVHSAPAMPRMEKELEKPVTVILMESDTFEVLNVRGNTLNSNYENLKDVVEKNTAYKKLLQLKVGSDNYSDSSAQTLFSLLKTKEVQVSAQRTGTEACQANSWDISDAYSHTEEDERIDEPSKDMKKIIKRFYTPDPIEDARLSNLLVSAGYLEAPATNTPGNLPSNLVQKIGPSSIQGSRRGTITGNTTGQKRGSFYMGTASASRRGSALGSVLASRRESTSGSVVGSRRGSTSGSLAPSLSRRGSKALPLLEDPLTRSSNVDRPAVINEEALILEEDSATSRKKDVDLTELMGLETALAIAERATAQNILHDKLLFYRDFKAREVDPADVDVVSPPVTGRRMSLNSSRSDSHSTTGKGTGTKQVDTATGKGAGPKPNDNTIGKIAGAKQVEWLWDFQCDLTEGRNISCLAWNKISKDLLTVGYGQFEFGSQKDGLIAFWSLKNPCYPHATIPVTSGVTALDFSVTNANLLAVGFYDGNIAIYDVRNPKDAMPMVHSSLATGKHNDPVWQVQWIDSNSEHGESLVSISTDGKVIQWFLKKELEYVILMTLKRVPSNSKGAQSQPFISRRAAGMCFDFSPRDSSIYLVGTEEGRIHKCSRSYNEQYLQTYTGHTGPVFQVRWSPFVPSLFLSCSSDWTVRLWQEEQYTALLVFQSSAHCLQDFRWSCTNACVFGTVSDDGHLEIWDLSISAVRPTIVYDEKRKLSSMLFSQNSPIVVSAGDSGAASVFRLVGFDVEEKEAEEAQKLRKALSANVNTLPD